ncbi:uncharacterized protein LOC128986934 [Macrosteles quadrilineatus]|uniref:uncharacterized protein LOC128986934 n=1 Tax=Macrosteles quadrilineatus TaxID=74068 RepID=UPI0023E094DE|nr:uncharacterized protein LOC128986934 [Macrosteles quadrilineatus]
MPPVKGRMLIYSEESMLKAIEEVKNGRSIKAAARDNNVPRSTLQNKLSGKSPKERRMGPEAVLNKTEESILVKWLFTTAKAGFPVSQQQLLDSVQHLLKDLKRKNPLKDDRPGRSWYLGFCKRNPSVSARIAQNLTQSRAVVSKDSLLNWFTEIHTYLEAIEQLDILEDPDRLFNADEAAFFLTQKAVKY